MTEQAIAATPHLREFSATDIVRHYATWSIAPGLLPTPILDIALLTGIQLRMISQLSKHYGVPFSASSGKSIIASLIGSVTPTRFGFGFTGLLIKTIPVIGGLLNLLFMPTFAWASTYAVGKVFIQHFESGGTFLSLDPTAVREHFHQEFEREYAARTKQPSEGAGKAADATKAKAAAS